MTPIDKRPKELIKKTQYKTTSTILDVDRSDINGLSGEQ